MSKRNRLADPAMSFLDLLSGALGAVLLLFLVIPKQQSSEQNPLHQQSLIKGPDQLNHSRGTLELDDFGPSNKVDNGFSFKGNKIVFVVDRSVSMQTKDNFGKVRAGLNMLINILSDSYFYNIVVTPGMRGPRPTHLIDVQLDKNGELKVISREDVVEAVNRIGAAGKSDIKEAIKFAQEIYDLTDIVLITDGNPKSFGRTLDDMYIYRDVRISVITVGELEKLKKGQERLKRLARYHGGFYVHF